MSNSDTPADDNASHLKSLREVYISVPPQARLNVIMKRFESGAGDIGPTRLVTVVSGVEALARSLIVHWPPMGATTLVARYGKWRKETAPALVQEVLRLGGQKEALEYFGVDAWDLFGFAVLYRNLIVHECTSLGQDRYPQLIEAAHSVFNGVVAAGSLKTAN